MSRRARVWGLGALIGMGVLLFLSVAVRRAFGVLTLSRTESVAVPAFFLGACAVTLVFARRAFFATEINRPTTR